MIFSGVEEVIPCNDPEDFLELFWLAITVPLAEPLCQSAVDQHIQRAAIARQRLSPVSF